MKATDQEQRLDEILADYLEAQEDGRAPTRQELLEGHPELAEQLAAFLADQDRFDSLVLPLRQASPSAPDTAVTGNQATPQPPGRDSPTLPGVPSGRFGDYELLELLARGGMGVVYKARQLRLDRLVALKMIRAGELASREEVERFRLEAAAAAHLDHPNIVPIYEVGEHDQLQFFSMKLVKGGSLAQSLAGGAWNDVDAAKQRLAARLMAQVARAVHYAHERGILHRDLKPSNILLQIEDCRLQIADGQSAISNLQSAIPLVTDFGLAKRLPGTGESAAEVTPTGFAVGTPGYIAPEQAAGRANELTTAADIYSMGAILYTLLTGRTPFQGSTPMEMLLQALEREPDSPRERNPALDADLATICLKCLAKEPGMRYASGAALAEDLERYLNDEPVQARPVTAGERLRRWCRRKPAVAGLVAALVFAVIAGFCLVTWQWRRAEQHAARAEAQFIRAEVNLAEAKDSLRLAHQAVNEFYTQVSEEKLRQIPSLEPLRKKLLEASLVYYQSFLEKSGHDDNLRAEVADTHYRIGVITSDIGSKSEAVKALQKAEALYQEVLHNQADDARVKTKLAETYRRIGILQKGMGNWTEALASYEKARDQYAALRKAQPENEEARYGLAAVSNNLGNLYRGKGKNNEALASFEEGRRLFEELVRTQPKSRQYRGALAASYTNLAILRTTIGPRPEGIRLYRLAIDLLEKLLEEVPTNLSSQKDLAQNYRLLGTELLAQRQISEAVPMLERSHARLERLARQHANNVDLQIDLAASHRQLGHALRDQGRRDQALAHYEQGRDILEKVVRADPGVPNHRNDLAKCYFDMGGIFSNQGRQKEALASYEKAVALRQQVVQASPDDLEFRKDLALSLQNVAVIQWNQGRRGEALANLRQSTEQRRLVSAQAPEVAAYGKDLAKTREMLARWETANSSSPH